MERNLASNFARETIVTAWQNFTYYQQNLTQPHIFGLNVLVGTSTYRTKIDKSFKTCSFIAEWRHEESRWIKIITQFDKVRNDRFGVFLTVKINANIA